MIATVAVMLPIIIYMLLCCHCSGWSQNVCMWGRNGSLSNSFLNGEYIYHGDINGAPWYRKDIDPSWSTTTTYLWRYGTKYYFTDYPPTPGTLSSYLARCMISTTNPSDCNSNWRVDSETFNDINLYSQNGSCPQWNCDEIISSQSYASCNGPFDTHITSNVWQKLDADNTRYWYFHPIWFMWVCSSTYSLGLEDNYWTFTQSKWVEMSSNSSTVNLDFQFPTQDSFQVQCIKYESTINPSVTPTQSPTKSPTLLSMYITTINTTVAPTKSPTLSSTASLIQTAITVANVSITELSETELIYTQLLETNSLLYTSESAERYFLLIIIGIFIVICCCIPLCCCLCFQWVKSYTNKNKAVMNNRVSSSNISRTAGYRISQSIVKDKRNDSNDEGLIVMARNKLFNDKSSDSMSISAGTDINRDNILNWLLWDNLELKQYVDKFIHHGYVDLNVIKSIKNISELRNIGIINIYHQTQIMEKINTLSIMEPVSPESVDLDNIIICYNETNGNMNDSQQLEIIYNDIINDINNIAGVNVTSVNGENEESEQSIKGCVGHQKHLTNLGIEGQ